MAFLLCNHRNHFFYCLKLYWDSSHGLFFLLTDFALILSRLYIVFVFSHTHLLCSHEFCRGHTSVPVLITFSFEKRSRASCDCTVAPVYWHVSVYGLTQVRHGCFFEIPFDSPSSCVSRLVMIFRLQIKSGRVTGRTNPLYRSCCAMYRRGFVGFWWKATFPSQNLNPGFLSLSLHENCRTRVQSKFRFDFIQHEPFVLRALKLC